MGYILVENDEGVIEVKNYDPERDVNYDDQKRLGVKLHGLFGCDDYCQTWCDYYNGHINRKELRRQLDIER